ncbi:Alpha/Beta hydrolase protein [Massariosphaeria phaeospora]|uniref:Alpha/Beta hydrolase protein n=1 Tax=Massariosphaeria phaeospora TaxID=100035 RepID=A0A7C8IAL0_9PLEO|nr:Alpha/Beta hydrolase protein [Massariosphaeria phaeospora]
MPRIGTTICLGMGAIIFGLLAICLDSLQHLLLRKAVAYGFDLPRTLRPQPVVFDHEKHIQYIGSRSLHVEHFQNIFYGEDTTGENRFAPPIPVRHAKGSVLDATQSGAWCPQGTGDVLPFTSQILNVSENCLSLRVARSWGTKPDAKLPVMVWIRLVNNPSGLTD